MASCVGWPASRITAGTPITKSARTDRSPRPLLVGGDTETFPAGCGPPPWTAHLAPEPITTEPGRSWLMFSAGSSHSPIWKSITCWCSAYSGTAHLRLTVLKFVLNLLQKMAPFGLGGWAHLAGADHIAHAHAVPPRVMGCRITQDHPQCRYSILYRPTTSIIARMAHNVHCDQSTRHGRCQAGFGQDSRLSHNGVVCAFELPHGRHKARSGLPAARAGIGIGRRGWHRRRITNP